jgi:hypothetical protein
MLERIKAESWFCFGEKSSVLPAWDIRHVEYLGWMIGLRGLRGRWEIVGDFLRSLELVEERFKVVEGGLLLVNVKGDTGKGGWIGMLLLLGGDEDDDAVDFRLDALLLFLIVLCSYGFDVVDL